MGVLTVEDFVALWNASKFQSSTSRHGGTDLFSFGGWERSNQWC